MAASAWVLTDGKAGMVNQALGFAEAMGLAPTIKTFAPRFPWSVLAPRLWLAPLKGAGPGSDALAPPWPDILVTCGSKVVAPSIAIRRLAAGRTRTVHVQTPGVSPAKFDLVVAPRHDGLSFPNVIVTRGAVHRVTARRLAEAAAKFAARFHHLPHPRVAVLVGGGNAVHHLTPSVLSRLAGELAELCRRDHAGLMVTASRRTGPENERRLRESLAGLATYMWDGTGDNPYYAFLALADAIVVTEDSVNMVSEGLATGKPVHVVALEGGSKKFTRFHAELRAQGLTRPFTGRLENWTYPPFDDCARAAAEARRRLGLA